MIVGGIIIQINSGSKTACSNAYKNSAIVVSVGDKLSFFDR